MHRLAIFLAILAVTGCGRREPVGVALLYEVDHDRTPPARKVRLDEVVAAMQRRLGGLADIQAAEQDRIEVRVYGNDSSEVERRLSQTGVLEFRILANRRDDRHVDVIELALEQAAVAKQKTVVEEGDVAARWDRVAPEQAEQLNHDPDLVLRTVDGGSLEALVMLDKYNVTGDYFTVVMPGTDQFGKPCLNFAFNAEGARRFGAFTQRNLPDLITDRTSSVAIILDGCIYTAPAIRSRIDKRGEITGNFTEAQITDLAALLSAGSLPAPVRLVKQRTVAPAD